MEEEVDKKCDILIDFQAMLKSFILVFGIALQS